jgi:aminoglycoside phosphotransferase (APT) family kinase protein
MARSHAAHDPTANRELRRVDWRFLVGQAEPTRVFCPVRGALSSALRRIAHAVVQDPEAGECDLVVLRDPTSATLRRAAAALAPGGSAYVEWWIPRPHGVAAARRRLNGVGLEDVRCFWPWPPPAGRTPQFWIPVDAPRVASWFLERHARHHVGRRAAAVRVLWRMLWRLGALVPLCATARKPAAVECGGIASLPALLDHEGANWGLANDELACALLTGGGSPRNKLVALGFSAAGADPSVVVKLARVREAELSLSHEAASLEAVHANRSVTGVPRLLGRATVAGRVAVVESHVDGRPLSDVLHAETHRALALKVTTFLVSLVTGAPPNPAPPWQRLLDERTLEALPLHEREQARAVLARLGHLPVACEHRDCSPWNVLVQPDGHVALLDWESAEPEGLPVLDLIYFLAYATFFVEATMHTGRERSSYGRMLDAATPVGRVYRECVRHYCAATAVPEGAIASLRLLCWLTHLRSARVLQSAGPTGPEARFDAHLLLELAREEIVRAGTHSVTTGGSSPAR